MSRNSRNVSTKERMRVINYCEFVALLAISAIINIKLAIILLFAAPAIIMLIVGLKEKNYHFFQDEYKEAKDIIVKDICA